MTEIDFAFGAPDRLKMACKVARKRHEAGQQLVVYCRDTVRLTAFDRMLWALDDISFIPHVWAGDPLAAQTPIVLTASDAETPHHQWLLNLDDSWPPIYTRFERLIEIVSHDAPDREAARSRWRFYQECGHQIVRHDLATQEIP